MGSVLGLVKLSTLMFVESDTALIQQANSDAASNLATQMRELFQSTTEKMRILGMVLLEHTRLTEDKERLIAEFFAKDKDFLAVYLETGAQKGTLAISARGLSPQMKTMHDPEGKESFAAIGRDPDFSFTLVQQGEVQITSVTLPDGEAAIALAVPFIQSPTDPSFFSSILVALVRQNRFIKSFSESEVITSYMVDRRGKVLAHPEADIVVAKENFSRVPIVKDLLDGRFNNGQTRFIDPKNGEPRLGSFRTVGFGGLGVVAEVAEAKAFEGAKKVVYRSAVVAWIILCISFLAGYLYSGTITLPIKKMSEAAIRISSGDFKINLPSKGNDELAHLSHSFNEMAKGLEERDRVKETFNKFHNKEIAEKLLSGEVKLGGERKTATIFFSDVRGFTALSESMEPEQVVEMLNEYMTRMVAIIRSYRGIVDKYVGDAIMAIWGVPIEGEDDYYNAVRACLAMREDLSKLNELRISRGQVPIKIGMGLNAGPLIAGNIGSDEKMEYTVIGDAVNLASRIESMTKEFGTDLLISKSIYEKVADRFVIEMATSTKVKGKSEAVEIFKVLGYLDENGQKVLVETPYSSYAAEKSDKVVHEEPSRTGIRIDRSLLLEVPPPQTAALEPDPAPASGGPEKPSPTPPPFQSPLTRVKK